MSRMYDAMRRARLVPVEGESPSGRGRRPSADQVDPPYNQPLQRLAQAVAWALGPGTGGVVLVTSAVPGEGASTVARKLAAELAARPARTLLIDANLREPSQHYEHGTDQEPGLADVATGGFAAVKAIRTPTADGAAFLPAGRLTESPGRILETLKVNPVMGRLRGEFEWIVVDCPAVTAYPDAVTLGGMADGVVLVVEAEKTRREVVEQARTTLERAGARVLGAVLNRRRYHIPEALYDRL